MSIAFLAIILGLAGPTFAQTWTLTPTTATVKAGGVVTLTIGGLSTTNGPQAFTITNNATYLSAPTGATQAMFEAAGVTSFAASISFDVAGVQPNASPIRLRVSDGTNRISAWITVIPPVVGFVPATPTVDYGESATVYITRDVSDAAVIMTLYSGDLSLFGVGTNFFGINYNSSEVITFEADEASKAVRISGLGYLGGTNELFAFVGLSGTSTPVVVNASPGPTSPMFLSVIAGNTAWLTASGVPNTTNYFPTVIYYSPFNEPRFSIPSNVTQELNPATYPPNNEYYSSIAAGIAGIYRMTNANPDPIPVHLLYTFAPHFGVYTETVSFISVTDPLLTYETQPIGVSVGDAVQIRIVRPGIQANSGLPFLLTSSDPSILTLSTALGDLGGGITNIQFGTFENDKIIYGHGKGLTEGVLATDVTVSVQVGSYITNVPVHVTRNGLLSLSPASPFVSAGDSLQMLVSRSTTNKFSALEVFLQTDVPGIAGVPASVMIEAGATSATFLVTGKAPGACIVSASAQGCETNANSSRTVTIGDPHLGFLPSPFTNLDVGVVGLVTLTRHFNEVGGPLTVSLLSQNPEIFTTTTATSTFQAAISDIQLGLQGVASGTGVLTVCAGSYCTNLTVVVKPAALTISSDTVIAGDTAALTVSRPCSASASDLTVHLQSLDSSALQVPATVLIPAGQCEAVFTATGIGPAAGVTIQAMADGYQPGSVAITVDNPSLDFTPLVITNVVGDTTTFVLSRPSSEAGAALAVTMQSVAPNIFDFPSPTVTIPAGYPSALVTLQGVSVGSGVARARVGTYVTNLSVLVVDPNLGFAPNPVTTIVGDSESVTVTRPSTEAGAALTVQLTASDPSLFVANAGSLTFAADAASANLSLTGLSPGTGLLHVASGSYVTDLTVVVESPDLTFSPDPASTVVGDTKKISISRPLSEAGAPLTIGITPSDTSLFRASAGSATFGLSETLVEVTLSGVAAGTGTLQVTAGSYSTNLVVVVNNPDLTVTPSPMTVALGDLQHMTITRQSSSAGAALIMTLQSSDSSIFRTSTNTITIGQGEYSANVEIIGVSPGTSTLQLVSSTYSSNITVVVTPPALTINPNPVPVVMGDASDVSITRPSTEAGADLVITLASSDPSIFRTATNSVTIFKDNYNASLNLFGIAPGTGTLQVISATFVSNVTVVVNPPTLQFSPDPASNVVGAIRRINIMRPGTQIRGDLTVTLTPSDTGIFNIDTNSFTLFSGQSSMEIVMTGVAMGTGTLQAAAGPYATNLAVIIGQPTITVTPSPITNLVGETRTLSFTRLSTQGGAVLPISLASSDPGIFRISTNSVFIGADSFTTNVEITGVSSGTGTLQVTISSFTNRIPVTIVNPVLTFAPLPLTVTSGTSRAVSLSRNSADTTLQISLSSDDGMALGIGTNIFTINYGTTLDLTFEPFELSKTIWISGLSFGDAVATLTARTGNYQTDAVVTVSGPGDPVVPLAVNVIAGNTALIGISNLPITTNNWPVTITYELPEYENRLLVPLWTQQSLTPSLATFYSGIGAPIAGVKRADAILPNPIPVRLEFFTDPGFGPYFIDETFVTVQDPTFTFLPDAPVVQVGDTIPLTVVRPPLEANASLPFTLTSGNASLLGLSTGNEGGAAETLSLTFNAVSASGSFYATEYPVYITARSLTEGQTSEVVNVTAQVGDYFTNIPIRITRNGLLRLSPASPTVIAGDGMTMTVSKSGPSNASPFDVTLNLGCSSGIVIAPTNVTIAAGATSATFNVVGLTPGDCTMIATAIGCETNANSSQNITVTDPYLTFSAVPYTNLGVSEIGDVKVIRPYNQVGGELTVSLLSLNPNIFEASSSMVTFAVGSSMAPIQLKGLAGGTGILSVCAGSYCTNLTVIIQPSALVLGSASVIAGNTAAMTLSRPCGAIAEDLIVRLQSLDTSALTVPESVTIPAGRCETVFTVTGVAPSAGVTIRAMADGYAPGSASIPVSSPTLVFSPAVVTNIAGDTATFAVSRPAGQEGAPLLISAQSQAANVFMFDSAGITIPAGDVSVLVTIRGVSVGASAGELRVGTYVTNVPVIVGSPTLSFAPNPMTVTVGDRLPVVVSRPSTEAGAELTVSLTPSDPNLFQPDNGSETLPANAVALEFNITGKSPGTGLLHVVTGTYQTNLTVVVTPPTITFSPDPASAVVGDTKTITLSRPLSQAGAQLSLSLTPSDSSLFQVSDSSVSIFASETSVSITLTGVGAGTGTLRAAAGTYVTNLSVVISNPNLSVSPSPATVAMGNSIPITVTRQSSEAGSDLKVNFASSDPSVFQVSDDSATIYYGNWSASVDILGQSPGTGILQVTASTFTTNVTVVVRPPTLSFSPNPASNVVGGIRRVNILRPGTEANQELTVTLTRSDPSVFLANTNAFTFFRGDASFEVVLTGLAAGTATLQAACGPYSTNLDVIVGIPTITVTPSPITNLVGETRVLTFTRSATEGGARLPISLSSSDPGIFSLATNAVVMGADSFTTNMELTGVSSGTGTLQVTISSYTNRIPVTINNPVLTFAPVPLTITSGISRAVTLSRDSANTELDVTITSDDGNVMGVGTNIFSVNYQTSIGLHFAPYELSKMIWVSGLTFEDSTAVLSAHAGNYSTSMAVNVNGPGDPVVPFNLSVIAGNTVWLYADNLPITTNNWPITIAYELPDYESRLITPKWMQQELSLDQKTFKNFIRASIVGVRRQDVLEPNPVPIRMEFFTDPELGPYYWATTYMTVLDPTFSFLPEQPVISVGDTIPLTVVRPPLESAAALPFTVTSSDSSILDISTNADGSASSEELSLVFEPTVYTNTQYATYYPVYISARALSQGLTSTVVNVTARVGDYATNIPVRVTRNGLLNLSPVGPTLVAGDTLPMSVSKSGASNATPFTVTLVSDGPTIVGVQTNVVIPAGATSATFVAYGLLPGTTTIRATGVGCETNANSLRTVTVQPPHLTFSPTPFSNEVNNTRSVYINRPVTEAGTDLKIQLVAVTAGIISLPTTNIAIAAGDPGTAIGITGVAAGQTILRAVVGAYSTNLPIVIGAAADPNDPDHDGLIQEWEEYLGGDPNNAHTFDPILNDGQFDSDGDGLSNLDEINIYGTDPARRDTDNDGVDDKTEVSSDLTNPLHPMSSRIYFEHSLNLGAAPAGFQPPRRSRFYVGTSGITIECWMRPVADGTGNIFSIGYDGTNAALRVGLENYRPKAEIFAGTNVLVTAGGVGANGSIQILPTNEWSHLAFVWSPGRNSLEIYVNSVLLIAQQSFSAPDFNGGPVTLASGFTSGYLDDLRVWNYDRGWEEISYWHNRIYPAPFQDYVQQATYGDTLLLYYRFDDAASNLVDFAFLNNTNYFLSGTGGTTVTNPAVSLLGSDDEDGDLLPEWWTKLNSIEKYPIGSWGPTFLYFDETAQNVARIAFFRSFKARTSVGGNFCWDDSTDNTNHCPKDLSLGWDGRFSTYMKYVYLYRIPLSATLNVYTPGMTNVTAYINGARVTPVGQETNIVQSLEIASNLKVGRNMVYVRCVSGYGKYLDESRTQQVGNDYAKFHYEGVFGKFDASLVCDGTWHILRGDYTKNDPRSVWFAQTWSTYEDIAWDPPYPDGDRRQLPGNQDYGVPFDEDNDTLNAYYEYLCHANPRDSDSDNNGTPDDEEDFDNDGLNNGKEQVRGASPILPDTDDDSLADGADSGLDNDPASALSPVMSRSIILGGSSNDYVEMPMQQRFALDSWTVESWVQRDPADVNGGVAVQRIVGPQGLNYELGLGNGAIAPVNVPYVRYASVNGTFVTATGLVAAGTAWTHLAGSYDANTGLLKLYVNGSNVNTAPVGQPSPAQFSGGPVIQRMGSGLRGQIDEVRIWSKARTLTEISNNYQKTVGGNEANLTAYYRFDDGTSYTNPPLIGTSANNGTNGNLHILPMTWGQAQDYVNTYETDWWDKWTHAASLRGNAWFTTNGGGAIGSPPSLQVNILPTEVNSVGAQWRIQGIGGWMNSGTTLSDGLEAGDYTILFQDVDGWTKPANTIVSLSNNVKTVLTTNYVQNGGIRVTIGPPAAVTAGAQWRLSGTVNWTNSDVALGNLTVGGHDVEFKPISEWAEPPVTNLLVAAGLTNAYIATYVPVTGAIQVWMEPNAAVTNGAVWRLDGGAARTNGEMVIGLALGAHTVGFQDALPWTGPPDILVTLTDGSLVTRTGVYSQATGIYVDIQPPAAVVNGARWRADSGPWLPPGTTYVTAAGTHLVQFNTATNWAPPPNQSVFVTNGYTSFLTVNYYAMTVYSAIGTNIVGLLKPSGMAFDPQRVLYIADRDHHRIVTIDTKTEYITNFGTYGTALGQFDQPIGLAMDGRTNLFVADLNNNRIQRRDGATGIWTAWGTKFEDHTPVGHFNVPYDVALDGLTNLYVADNQNHRIQKKDPAGNWSVIVTNGLFPGYVRVPEGLAVDSSNYLYVADYPDNTGRIQMFGPTNGNYRATVADSNTVFGTDSNKVVRPRGMSFGPSNLLYIADWYGSSVLCRDTNGVWNTILSSNVLKHPEGVLWDNRGFLWIADTENDRVLRIQVGTVTTNIPVSSWIGPGGGGNIIVYWNGAPYWFYTVQYNDNLMTPYWTNFANAINIPGSNGVMNYTDTNAASAPSRSYRVQGY